MDENETDALAATLAAARGRKRHAGKKIKAWTAAFKAEHGREPTLEEKEVIRDLYSQYARATGTLKTIKNKAATSKHGEVPRSSELQAVQTTHALEVERAKEVDDVESKIEERLERMREVQPSASSPETSFLEDEVCPQLPYTTHQLPQAIMHVQYVHTNHTSTHTLPPLSLSLSLCRACPTCRWVSRISYSIFGLAPRARMKVPRSSRKNSMRRPNRK